MISRMQANSPCNHHNESLYITRKLFALRSKQLEKLNFIITSHWISINFMVLMGKIHSLFPICLFFFFFFFNSLREFFLFNNLRGCWSHRSYWAIIRSTNSYLKFSSSPSSFCIACFLCAPLSSSQKWSPKHSSLWPHLSVFTSSMVPPSFRHLGVVHAFFPHDLSALPLSSAPHSWRKMLFLWGSQALLSQKRFPVSPPGSSSVIHCENHGCFLCVFIYLFFKLIILYWSIVD